MNQPTPLHTVESEPQGIRDTSAQDIAVETTGRKIWILVAVVLAALGAASLLFIPAVERWFAGDKTVARERIRVATVSLGAFTRDIAIQGTIVAAVSPTVFAPNSGTVSLKVNAGDAVRIGEELAVINSPELGNALAQERATLDSLELNLQRQELENRKAGLANQQQADLAQLALVAAQRELRRAEQSWERKLISVQDLEKARDDVSSAQIDATHAENEAALDNESLAFELKSLRLQRDRQQLLVANLQRQNDELVLRSPVQGIVGNLSVDQRANVAANAPLLTVVDLSAFEIDAEVSESYSDDIGIGMDATLTYSGQPFAAQVTAISPEVENGSVQVRLRFSAEKPSGLRQNQRLSGRILLEHKAEALTVDRGAFLQSGGGRVAYLLKDDVALRTPIQVGSSSINKVEILSGLQAGDQVIISSTDAFEDAETILVND